MDSIENPNPNEASKWYVLQALSGRETHAFSLLHIRCEQDRQAGIDNGIDELHIPEDLIDTGRKNREGKPILRGKKRFPGYILIKVRLFDATGERDAHTWEVIHRTQGIIGFIGKEKPVEIKQEQVNEMLATSASADKPKQRVDYKIGETVQLLCKSFLGYEGVIENIDLEHNRLKVSVNMFGRSTPLEIGIDEVERPKK